MESGATGDTANATRSARYFNAGNFVCPIWFCFLSDTYVGRTLFSVAILIWPALLAPGTVGLAVPAKRRGASNRRSYSDKNRSAQNFYAVFTKPWLTSWNVA